MRKTSTPDIEIIVIKQSAKGAWLISDGTHQCWVRPSCRRADGTWTPSAYTAIQASTTPCLSAEEQALLDGDQEARKQAWIEAKAKERELERERRSAMMYILLNSGVEVLDGTEKAYKIATGRKIQNPYKFKRDLINEYIYLPKSQVSFKDTPTGKVLAIPTWLYEEKSSLFYGIGVVSA